MNCIFCRTCRTPAANVRFASDACVIPNVEKRFQTAHIEQQGEMEHYIPQFCEDGADEESQKASNRRMPAKASFRAGRHVGACGQGVAAKVLESQSAILLLFGRGRGGECKKFSYSIVRYFHPH